MKHTQGKITNQGQLHGREDHYRVVALWNGADGMPTEEAVRYLEHGRDMVESLKNLCNYCYQKNDHICKERCEAQCETARLLKKIGATK